MIGAGAWTDFGSPVALDGSGQAPTNYTPLTADSYQFQAIYSGDGTYNGATSGTTSLTVTAVPPTVAIAPSGSFTMDAGQTKTFTATPSGGTGTIHYQWYVGAGTVGTDSSSYTYTASGSSASITCKVTDSASPPVTSPASNAVTITVNAAMSTPSITPVGPLTMDAGQTQTFTLAAVSGGSGSKTNQWYLDGSAVAGQTGTTYTYTAATAGSPHSVYVSVTDSASTPVTVQSNTVSITVNAAMSTPSITPAGPLAMTAGNTQTFTLAAVSGGTGAKTNQWYLDGSAVAGQTGATYTYTAASGAHTVYVRVTDSASTPITVQSNTVAITVTAAPSITISPTYGGSNTVVTVSGSGFAANSAITIKFNGNTVKTTTSTSAGAIPSGVTFTVSNSGLNWGNYYTVTATDASSNSASATYRFYNSP